MRLSSCLSLAIILATAGGIAACQPDVDDSGDASANALEENIDSRNGGIYHLSEGGEVMPLFVLRALRAEVDGEEVPFMSPKSLQRFGFIADPVGPDNPEGLPVGLTLGRAADTALVSVGFNCSTCHVQEIRYTNALHQTKKLRIDGGGSNVDFSGFNRAVGDALRSSLGKDSSLWDKSAFAARAITEAAKVSRQYQDFDGTADSAWTRFKMLWTVITHARDVAAGDVKSAIEEFDIPDARKRLLYARYVGYRGAAGVIPGKTPSGPGSTDPFGDGSNYLFFDWGYHKAPQSQMRYQSIFEMNDKAWYDVTSNANSILKRNIIQAMAVGGVTDISGENPTYVTSLDMPNIIAIGESYQALRAPTWPEDLPYDATLAARGKSIFQATCAGCHEPQRVGSKGLYDVQIVPLEKIGTDSHEIDQYLTKIPTPTGDQLNLGEIANLVGAKLLENYCASAKLTKGQCLELDDAFDAKDNPTGRRDKPIFTTTATGYQADILDGAWSQGRVLHNGAVPSIADLLKPAAERPKKFAVGHSDYDPERLGYTLYTDLTPDAKKAGATTIFDTTLPGNSNAGHEGERYGTDLPDEDKKALLEYLKKHRSAR